MEDEMKNLIKVWILALTSLSYCYFIASKIPTKGFLRLFSLIPIFYLFIILPLNLSSIHLCGVISFFLVWLANFKLILFAFDQGPLSHPNIKHHQFILISCLPIKIKEHPHVKLPSKPFQKIENPNNNKNPSYPSSRNSIFSEKSNLDENNKTLSHKNSPLSPRPSIDENTKNPSPKNKKFSQEPSLERIRPLLLVIKVVLLFILFDSYKYRHSLHRYTLLAMYCCHVYLELEIVLAIGSIPARFFGFHIEPQSNEPYLSTSLQDFWGYRWNLMVTDILRPTVYNPIRRVSTPVIGRKWAQLLGIISSFVVSGLMHEAIYYYLMRVPPTWEVTWFFVMHGVCLAIEVLIKRKVDGRWRLPPAVSGPLTVAFVAVTGIWLFFAQIFNNNLDEKVVSECLAMIDFMKSIVLDSSGKFKI